MVDTNKRFRFTYRWPIACGLALLTAIFGLAGNTPGQTVNDHPASATGNQYLSVAAQLQNPTGVQTVVGYKALGGKLAKVELIIAPRPGVDGQIAAAQALKSAGVTSTVPWSGFLTIGSLWPEFSDHSRRNNAVSQSYNPAGDPTGDGLVALENAQKTWNSVSGSMFRFSLAGLTTRCSSLAEECTGGAPYFGIPGAPFADGHNDIAWVQIQMPSTDFIVFGYFVFLVDPFTGELFEADGVLSRDISPFAWSTDGAHDVDLETIMLHEEGHALGLAHAFSETALMFNAYHGVQRTLTSAETDGVLALYPKHPSLLTDTPSAHDFTIVAEANTPAPGGGTFLNVFETGGVNSRGDLAFVTDVPEGQGFFVASRGGTVRQIVRSGMAAPGGVPFGAGPLSDVALNDAGDVAFCWLQGPFELPAGINAGMFRVDAGGELRTLMSPGVTPAPGGGVFVGCLAASMSNNSDVAFTGLVLRGSDVEQGAFVARRDGSIVRVAGPGDAAPGGGIFRLAQFPRIAPNGRDVAFEAALAGATQLGAYVSRAATGRIEVIARPGDPAPGGGTIVRARQARVNSSGTVLYGALVQLSPQIRSMSLFITEEKSGSRRIAGYGDMLPDGLLFENLVVSQNSWTLNESGDVAFLAQTKSLPIPFFGSTLIFVETGVYALSRSQLRFIAREGSILLGAGRVLSVSPGPSPAIIDDRGDVVFGMLTEIGRLMLMRAGPKVSN